MMLIQNSDGTMTAGPKDIICILNDQSSGKYHAAFFEEAPLPGNPTDIGFVRLKSKMHHTQGSDTLEGAKEHVKGMLEKIIVDDANVWSDVQPWDGSQGLVWTIPDSAKV